MEENKKDLNENKKPRRNKEAIERHKTIRWILIITVVSFVFSFCFSLGTELVVSNADLIVSIVLLVLIIAISIFCDAMGVAITSADPVPFTAMATKKVKGSKTALYILKNADRFSSIFNDVIGDVCGIVSGACGASISLMIALKTGGQLWVSIIVSALIAAITIGGKAIMKGIAIKNSTKFVLFFGKFISIFKKERK